MIVIAFDPDGPIIFGENSAYAADTGNPPTIVVDANFDVVAYELLNEIPSGIKRIVMEESQL